MSHLPQVFNFGERPIEVHTVNGEPWWVGRDVCEVLGISQPHRSIAQLDDDEKGRHTVTTLGGRQEVVIVNEAGLYSLILRSRKPEAKTFKRWITHEVLPAIRKTGAYLPDAQAAALTQAIEVLSGVVSAQNALSQRVDQLASQVERIASGKPTVEKSPEPTAQAAQKALALPHGAEKRTVAGLCRQLASKIREASHLAFPNVWNLAYDRYDARMGGNIRAECREARYGSVIQYIEDYGDIEALHAILMRMYMKLAA
jgi:prophage antirepressor-like protein